MKSAKNKRKLTLLTLVVALGVAVYLNWEYAKNDLPFETQEASAVNAQTSAARQEDLAVVEPLPDKNYGYAQLVNSGGTGGSQYFEQARLTRSKTRDEALDKLQKSLKNAGLTQDEKTSLTQRLSAEIESITVESDIENMVRAKGFVDCVAFIDGEKVNLAVQTGSEGLDKTEVAQLRDIVLGKMNTDAKNISIVEVK